MLIVRIDATWILACLCTFTAALICHMNKPSRNIDTAAGVSISGAIAGFVILLLLFIWS